jgi:hypothetical protein
MGKRRAKNGSKARDTEKNVSSLRMTWSKRADRGWAGSAATKVI